MSATDTPSTPGDEIEKKQKPILVRLWPIYIILGGLALAISQGWHTYLTPESLSQNAVWLDQMVRENLLLVLGAYILVYAASTAFLVPGSALTLIGGFLFPVAFGVVPIMGALATVFGATLGACILFIATKTSVGAVLRDIAGPFLGKMEKEFNANPISYMVILRLVPVVPFSVANIAPGLLGAKFRHYALTTFFGIMPGTLAYTWIGSGLKETLLANPGQTPDVGALAANLGPAFIALGVVSLIPLAYNKFIKKSPSETAEAGAA